MKLSRVEAGLAAVMVVGFVGAIVLRRLDVASKWPEIFSFVGSVATILYGASLFRKFLGPGESEQQLDP